VILSNVAIAEALAAGDFAIEGLAGDDPGQPPFNTSSVDLRLSDQLIVPTEGPPVAMDLRQPGIAAYLTANSRSMTLTAEQPFALEQNQFVLGNTVERVSFPPLDRNVCYAARVEGRSSLARCGILVHFTAPTIHAGFTGAITLEIINLGFTRFLLFPGLRICQLIIEEVKGRPSAVPNQFLGQTTPAGSR